MEHPYELRFIIYRNAIDNKSTLSKDQFKDISYPELVLEYQNAVHKILMIEDELMNRFVVYERERIRQERIAYELECRRRFELEKRKQKTESPNRKLPGKRRVERILEEIREFDRLLQEYLENEKNKEGI